MKIIAFYLPQFHEVDINNDNYGKGFTEWDTTENAKPLFKGHTQPRIPWNKYCLTEKDAIMWQAELAKENGIYGWAIYHYWYKGKLVLEKPVEKLLHNKDIEIHFCLDWANHHWTKSLQEKSKEIILEQTYGDEADWKRHFEYFLPYFQDNRYIYIDNKPVLIVYRPYNIPRFNEMVSFWNECAKDVGLQGVTIIQQQSNFIRKYTKGIDYRLEYQPTFIRNNNPILFMRVKVRSVISKAIRWTGLFQGSVFEIWFMRYEYIWDKILKFKPDDLTISGAFVNWDNSPRKKKDGFILTGYSVEKFREYLSKKIKITREKYAQSEYMFLFAWNEWGEGGFLEPDLVENKSRLKAIREALIENDEWE